MKKAIIWCVCFVVMSVAVAFAGDDVPADVPPCPDEYQGGLIP